MVVSFGLFVCLVALLLLDTLSFFVRAVLSAVYICWILIFCFIVTVASVVVSVDVVVLVLRVPIYIFSIDGVCFHKDSSVTFCLQR